jgi:hypothetical protein
MAQIEVIEAIGALRGAQIVQIYGQGSDDRTSEHPWTGGGWCFGMCVQWLKANRDGREFWPWFRTSEGFARTQAVQTLHHALLQGLQLPSRPPPDPWNHEAIRSRRYKFSRDPEGVYQIELFLLNRAGFQIAPTMSVPYLRPDANIHTEPRSWTANPLLVVSAIRATHCQFIQLGFFRGSLFRRKGHALALIHKNGHGQILDPNYGEFAFSSWNALACILQCLLSQEAYKKYFYCDIKGLRALM